MLTLTLTCLRFLRVTFPLLLNQVHTGHNAIHVFCAVYLDPRDMKFSALCIAWKSEAQVFQWYTIYLVLCNKKVSYGSEKVQRCRSHWPFDNVAEEGGDCGEGSATNRHDKTGKDDSGPAPFVFNWAEAPANSIEPDLPKFREPTGSSSEPKLAKTPLLWSAYLWHRQTYMLTSLYTLSLSLCCYTMF